MSTYHKLSAFQLLLMFSLSLMTMYNKETLLTAFVPDVNREHRRHVEVQRAGQLNSVVK